MYTVSKTVEQRSMPLSEAEKTERGGHREGHREGMVRPASVPERVQEPVKEQQEWPRLGGGGEESPWQCVMTVERGDRWAVWRRLQELGIPCTCGADRPLVVTVASPVAAWQVWHVAMLPSAPARLRGWLERCYEAGL